MKDSFKPRVIMPRPDYKPTLLSQKLEALAKTNERWSWRYWKKLLQPLTDEARELEQKIALYGVVGFTAGVVLGILLGRLI